MSAFEQQRDILFEACKKIATDQKCPKWIADILRDAVIKAKNIKDEFPTFDTDQKTTLSDQPLQIGDVVIVNNNNTSCVAKLIEEEMSPGDIRIFNIQVVEGNNNHMIGQIFHNVPETMMRRK